ncbi:hypothetical protein M1D48_10025 [Erwinia sp. D4-22]
MENFDSATWTVEQYEQNRPTLSARSHVIFIGNAEENRFTKIYLTQISNITNVHGVCFGYDGSKAVVFGEGKEVQKHGFEKYKNEVGYGIASGTMGVLLSRAFITAVPFTPLIGGIGYFVYKFFRSRNELKELRKEQTKLATFNFLLTEFEPWIGIEKNSL